MLRASVQANESESEGGCRAARSGRRACAAASRVRAARLGRSPARARSTCKLAASQGVRSLPGCALSVALDKGFLDSTEFGGHWPRLERALKATL